MGLEPGPSTSAAHRVRASNHARKARATDNSCRFRTPACLFSSNPGLYAVDSEALNGRRRRPRAAARAASGAI